MLINRAGEEYFGVPREAMIGKLAQEVFPKGTADIIVEHDQDLLKSCEPQFYDDGRYRPRAATSGSRRRRECPSAIRRAARNIYSP